MKKIILFMVVVLLFAASVTTAQAETVKMPLSKLTAVQTPDLRCTSGEFTIHVPVPDRWDVKRATVSVSYVSSPALTPDRSYILATFNGRPIGVKKFGTVGLPGRFDGNVDPALFEPGYNTLNISVAQHYTLECERPCSPELWTKLELEKSTIEIEYTLKPVPLKLSEATEAIFDPKITPAGDITIVMQGRDSESVTLSGIVASGIAKRFDYRKVYFNVSKDLTDGKDNIFVGTGAEASALLAKYGQTFPKVDGPFIKLMHMPLKSGGVDKTRALLVLTGRNKEDIKIAAETLTSMTIAFPGTSELKVTGFKMPEIKQYGGRLVLDADKEFDFKTLNIPTTTYEGFNPPPMDFNFRLPADFLIKQNQYAELVLNFAYGAGLRPDSVLLIMLNGKTIRSIHLNNTGGDMIEKYKINIPTYLFKPGGNIITFASILSVNAQECDLFQTRNMFVTVFDNSTFYFPQMGHFVELPALELFMLNGFPITRWPDGFGSTIYLTEKDDQYISAAYNLIGLISQKNGYPAFGVTITYEKPDKYDGELIVIGHVAGVPEEYRKLAPLKLTNPLEVPYPVVRSWEEKKTFAYSTQEGGLGPDEGMFMQFASPYKEGRSVLFLTAATDDDVLKLSKALLDPEVQGEVKGDLVMVEFREPKYKVTSLKVGESYTSGKLGNIGMIDYYLSSYPKLYIAVVIGLIIVLAFLAYYLMMRLRKRRTVEGGKGA
ncbi:MAG: cellulose biosynthesis cyclic di-GMP-binding regulatory protein BcsB [Deltaproteobacteria bacterium]|nr:cellulose biosynthesis cyclic di-GMP-binding regulatory protein BcsB [Deltaproteobacteria bacterium]